MPLFSSGPPSVEPHGAASASAADVWLSAVTYWYLTGLLAALGFSFGLYLVRPASGSLPENRDWLDAFTWMDGRWYKQIATQGYEYDPDKGTNVAFFPVYPLLGRAVMAVPGLRAEAALLIVSNLSLLAALAILAFYVRDRYPDAPAELADYTVLAAALFPTGCFFRFAYSESTFLLLLVLAMYAMLRRWPLWAIALLIGLATAARPVGVALLAPFAIHLVRRSSSPSGKGRVRESAVEEADAPRSRFGLLCARLALYLPLASWGLGAFILYQYFAFGEPLAFVKVQTHWGTPASWPEKLLVLETLGPVRSVYDPGSSAFWMRRDPHGLAWFSLQFALCPPREDRSADVDPPLAFARRDMAVRSATSDPLCYARPRNADGVNGAVCSGRVSHVPGDRATLGPIARPLLGRAGLAIRLFFVDLHGPLRRAAHHFLA